MSLVLFDTDSTRSVIADWVELSVEFSLAGRISSSDLRRAESVREEPDAGVDFDEESGETVEREIAEPGKDELLQAIYDELTYRQKVLGDDYPYQLITSRGEWTVEFRGGGELPARCARLAYRFCLLVSAMRYGMIEKVKDREEAYASLTVQMAHEFQALSFLAGPHIVCGEAYWFGWPRPDRSKFQAALKDLVVAIGHGKVKAEPPAYADGSEKDGTVDLVVWRPFRDRQQGSILVVGQVASGKNWPSKPVKAFINGNFYDWFEDRPSRHYLPALFIPFPLHERVSPPRGQSFHVVARDIARQNENNYGTILDRLRLVELIRAGSESGRNLGDFAAYGPGILRWLARCRAYVVPGVTTTSQIAKISMPR